MAATPSIRLPECRESMKTTGWVTIFTRARVLRWATGAAVVAAVVSVSAPLRAVESVNVGVTSIVVRTVTGEIEEKVRHLVVKDSVYLNEVIGTAPDSATEIDFLDGTKISLGPNVRMTLDKFVFDPKPGRGTFVMTATEGVLRFFSGNLENSAYVIKTPTATIGIRGTIFTVVVLPDGTTAITLDQPSSCVYVENLFGQLVKLCTPGLGTVISPGGNMTPPGVPPAWVLALLDGLNDFFPFVIPAAGGGPVFLLRQINGTAENPCPASASPNCNN